MRGLHLQNHVTHRSRGHVANQKRFISTFTRPMDPKGLGWVDPTHNVTWHFDFVVTWQIKNVIFPLSYMLRTPNLAGWWLRIRETHLQSHVTLLLCVHVTNQKYFVLNFTRHKVHKLSRMVTRMRRPRATSHVPPRSCRHVTTI